MDVEMIEVPRALRGHSAIFGDYLLVLHDGDDDPGDALLGYVLLEGEDTIRHAMRLNDRWYGENKRPFTKQIVSWYLFEQPDGTPLFRRVRSQ